MFENNYVGLSSAQCEPCEPGPEASLQRARKEKEKAELMLDNLRIFIESAQSEYFGDDIDRLVYQLLGRLTALVWGKEKQIQHWLDQIDK
jgi:hypothetical protein